MVWYGMVRRVALAMFSTSAIVSFDYSFSYSIGDLVQKVTDENVEFLGDRPFEGETAVGAGLELLVEDLNANVGQRGYRGGAPVVIVVTDGNPTDSKQKLEKYASILEDRVCKRRRTYLLKLRGRIGGGNLKRNAEGDAVGNGEGEGCGRGRRACAVSQCHSV